MFISTQSAQKERKKERKMEGEVGIARMTNDW